MSKCDVYKSSYDIIDMYSVSLTGAGSLQMAAFSLVGYSSSESSDEETVLSSDSFTQSVAFGHTNDRKRKISIGVSKSAAASKQLHMDEVNK